MNLFPVDIRQENRILDLKVVDGSVTEIAVLSEAKKYLYITFDDDDDFIIEKIAEARELIENKCNISIVEKIVTLTISAYKKFQLPLGPVKSITSATIRTGTGTSNTMVANTDYELTGSLFKFFDPLQLGEITIVYKTGYSGGYPVGLKKATLSQVAFDYAHRGDEIKIDGLCPAALLYSKPFINMAWR